jgi:hypothetical protein
MGTRGRRDSAQLVQSTRYNVSMNEIQQAILDALGHGPRYKAKLRGTRAVGGEFAWAWRELTGRFLVDVGLEFEPGLGRPLRLTRAGRALVVV